MSTIALPVDQVRSEGLIGASEAAAALGHDRYKSPITLWRQLRGLDTADERPDHVNEAAEWGQALEPVVRGKYALVRDVLVMVPEQSFTMDGWLRATPDGLVFALPRGTPHGDPPPAVLPWTEAEERAEPRWREKAGLYQGKTCSAFLRDEWEGGIPAKYEIQVRVEMAVTRLPWCDVCCLVGGQRFVGPFRIERDLKLEDRLLTDLRAFWDMVKEGREPNPDHTAAWRQHISERMRPSKVTIQADEDLAELVEYWLECKRKAGRAEEEADEARNELLLKLSAAGATAILLPDGRKVTAYKTGGRTDWKGYAMSLGGKEPPANFKAESKTWALRAPNDE